MLFLLIMAALLSSICVGLTQFFAWPLSVLDWLLGPIGLWCAFQLIWTRIADLRAVIYSMDYQPVKHAEVPIPREWRSEAYGQAALAALLMALFGGLLGAGIGWWLAAPGLIWKYSLQLGLAYGLPFCFALSHLAKLHIETRRFIAQRKP